MIGEMRAGQMEEIIDIWLASSFTAHSFVPAEYWRENAALVRQCLARARTFVEENAGRVQGFLSVMPDGYVGALFVREEERGRGIGKKLLDRCKACFNRLTLQVYTENAQAVGFYRRRGFTVVKEQTDQNTGHTEYVMAWTKE